MKLDSLSLKKHERPITCLAFNRTGEFLFSASKDLKYNLILWNPKNGDLVGFYIGHEGVVSYIDVNYNSTMILTASVDKTVRFWEIESGREIFRLEHPSMMRCCKWSLSEKRIACVQEKLGDITSQIFIYDIDDDLRVKKDPKNQTKNCLTILEDTEMTGSFSKVLWAELDTVVISCGSDGLIRKWSPETGDIVQQARSSDAATVNMELAREDQLLITSNLDNNAKIFFVDSLEVFREIRSDRQIHAAVMLHNEPLVIMAGGQNKRDVTQTSSEEGKLEVLYYDFVQAKLLGQTKNHFGPIYSIKLSPDDSSCMVTGGEDSFVRVHFFGEEFFEMCSKIER